MERAGWNKGEFETLIGFTARDEDGFYETWRNYKRKFKLGEKVGAPPDFNAYLLNGRDPEIFFSAKSCDVEIRRHSAHSDQPNVDTVRLEFCQDIGCAGDIAKA